MINPTPGLSTPPPPPPPLFVCAASTTAGRSTWCWTSRGWGRATPTPPSSAARPHSTGTPTPAGPTGNRIRGDVGSAIQTLLSKLRNRATLIRISSVQGSPRLAPPRGPLCGPSQVNKCPHPPTPRGPWGAGAFLGVKVGRTFLLQKNLRNEKTVKTREKLQKK